MKRTTSEWEKLEEAHDSLEKIEIGYYQLVYQISSHLPHLRIKFSYIILPHYNFNEDRYLKIYLS